MTRVAFNPTLAIEKGFLFFVTNDSLTRYALRPLPSSPAPRILPRYLVQQSECRHAPQRLYDLAVLPAPSPDIPAEILMPALPVCLVHFPALRYSLASCSNNQRKHSPPLPTSSTSTHRSEHLPCSCSAFMTRRGSSPLALIQCISVWLTTNSPRWSSRRWSVRP